MFQNENVIEKENGKLNIFSNIFAIKNIVIYVISFMLSMVTLGGEFSIFSISMLGASLASSVPILGVILVSIIGNAIHTGVGGAVRILPNSTSIPSNTIHNKTNIQRNRKKRKNQNRKKHIPSNLNYTNNKTSNVWVHCI